jgi:prepilin-type N-terminal cleavage/methylation domain-containing protein
MKYSGKCQNGFTLIEVIAVLIILGILVAVVISRSSGMDASLYSETEVIKTHLRYAQTQAMNKTDAPTSSSPVLFWGVKCSGGSYWLFEGTSPDVAANIRVLPDNAAGSDKKVVLATKKVGLSDFTVCFDGRGVPYSTDACVLLAADLSITVTSTVSSETKPITITQLTGFIP